VLKLTPSSMKMTLAGSAIALALLAGCGGGGGYSSVMQPGPTSSSGNNSPLSTATLKGAPGFVNSSGLTVYVFDLDLTAPGQSTCNGTCAQNWPPVAAPAGSLPSPWTAITRQDGSHQLAYAGRPLYTFSFDTAPGQTNGDGVNAFGGNWHIARPQASSPAPTMSPTSQPSGY